MTGTQTSKSERTAEFYSADVLVERTAGEIPAKRTGHRAVFNYTV